MTYVQMYDRATAVRNAIVERARKLAADAGLDPSCPFHHAHNAWCAAEMGRPWSGVDYAVVRKLRWLEQRSFVPHRIVSRWCGKRTLASMRGVA
jgi:hypothetical protein